MTNIVIYTALYPFNRVSESFLTEELEVVPPKYSITVVPVRKDSYERLLPKGISLDRSLCDSTFYKKIQNAIRILAFLKWTTPRRILQVFKNGNAGKALKYLYAASLVYGDLSKRAVTETPTVFYGYWLFYMPIAFAAYKYHHPNCAHKFILRGHGTDVYAEDVGVYIPLRSFSFTHVDSIFTISENGLKYLENKYPQLKGRIHLSRLGVKDNFVKKSQDGCVRFVSCSRVISLKRVELIFLSLLSYSRNHPEKTIEWTHFGDGAQFDSLKKVVHEKCEQVTTLNALLPGGLNNYDILNYYKKTNIDCFIILSTSEGIPVSIMEAIASGIPVIATNVGGVNEIVNDNTGYLLRPDFTQEEFNQAVDYILNNRDWLQESAHTYYMDHYDSVMNYTEFYNIIAGN